MAYTRTNWRNNSFPAVNEINLNHIEQGIYDAHLLAEALASETQTGRLRFANGTEVSGGTSGDTAVSPQRLKELLDVRLGGYVSGADTIPRLVGGTLANRPAPEIVGRIYFAYDASRIFYDTGTSWQALGAATWTDIEGKPSTFAPSVHASSHAVGGVDAVSPSSIGALPSSTKATDIGGVSSTDSRLNRYEHVTLFVGGPLSLGQIFAYDFSMQGGTIVEARLILGDPPNSTTEGVMMEVYKNGASFLSFTVGYGSFQNHYAQMTAAVAAGDRFNLDIVNIDNASGTVGDLTVKMSIRY